MILKLIDMAHKVMNSILNELLVVVVLVGMYDLYIKVLHWTSLLSYGLEITEAIDLYDIRLLLEVIEYCKSKSLWIFQVAILQFY